jgi:hypothetical protein
MIGFHYKTLLSTGKWGQNAVYVVGNRPVVEQGNSMACCFGPIFIRAHRRALLKLTEKEACFEITTEPGKIIVTNESLPRTRMECSCLG